MKMYLIELLQKEKEQATKILEKLGKQEAILIDMEGKSFSALNQEIEIEFMNFQNSVKKVAEMSRNYQAKTSWEADKLQTLRTEIGALLPLIHRQLDINRALLNKQMQYNEFGINVLTRTSSDNSYAEAGTAMGATRGLKMFDQSI